MSDQNQTVEIPVQLLRRILQDTSDYLHGKNLPINHIPLWTKKYGIGDVVEARKLLIQNPPSDHFLRVQDLSKQVDDLWFLYSLGKAGDWIKSQGKKRSFCKAPKITKLVPYLISKGWVREDLISSNETLCFTSDPNINIPSVEIPRKKDVYEAKFMDILDVLEGIENRPGPQIMKDIEATYPNADLVPVKFLHSA